MASWISPIRSFMPMLRFILSVSVDIKKLSSRKGRKPIATWYHPFSAHNVCARCLSRGRGGEAYSSFSLAALE